MLCIRKDLRDRCCPAATADKTKLHPANIQNKKPVSV
jgi:hypothetical protein